MKKFIGVCLVFVLCALGVVSVQAANVTVVYTEPTQNLSNDPITNLYQMKIYYKQDSQPEAVVVVAASAATGGGTVSRTFAVQEPALCGSTTVTVQVAAQNTNMVESARTTLVSATKTNTDASCNTPKSPTGVSATIQ